MNEMKKEKVLLVGNFGSRNVGDEIILWTALQKYPDAIVMTADAEFSRRFLQIGSPTTKREAGRISSKELNPTFIPPFPTGIRSFLKFIFDKKSREKLPLLLGEGGGEVKIIFPGGGLLAIKLRAYLIWAIMVWWLRKYFPNAEIIFEHQGIDKKHCPVKKALVKHIFKGVNKISVRDKNSRDFLQSLHIKSVEDSDRVEKFLLSSPPDKGELEGVVSKSKTPEFGGISKNLVLINACRQNPAKFSDLCTPKTLPRGTRAAFVCFDPSDAKYVPPGFKGEIIFPENVAETFKLFQRAKMAIGQRLHFLILANHFCGTENTFTLGQPYSQKVENFAEKYKIKPFLIKK